MEFFLQQEGSLGTILFLAALLIGILYIVLPVFAWRIWFWSRQNSKSLEQISKNLELLIRDIAPDALPPEPVVEEPQEEQSEPEETETAEDSEKDFSLDDEEDFFPKEEFTGDLSDDDDMEFSMSGDFDDVSDEIADSSIDDYTDRDEEDLSGSDDDTSADGEDDGDEDELVMDFDDEPAEEDDQTTAEATETPTHDEEPESEFFRETEPDTPDEIPLSSDSDDDFTVEHFKSNEDATFEFEDVDDDDFGMGSDSFDESEIFGEPAEQAAAETPSETEPPVEEPPAEEPAVEPSPAGSAWGEAPTDDIWGEEASLSAKTEPTYTDKPGPDEFSFGGDDDLGSAFDEPEPKKENVSDVANSFLSDLEEKLNLDNLAERPVAPPVSPAPPEPKPEPPPAPKPATEQQATLFARCEGCGHKLAYKQALSGKRVRCPACRTAFSLP